MFGFLGFINVNVLLLILQSYFIFPLTFNITYNFSSFSSFSQSLSYSITSHIFLLLQHVFFLSYHVFVPTFHRQLFLFSLSWISRPHLYSLVTSHVRIPSSTYHCASHFILTLCISIFSTTCHLSFLFAFPSIPLTHNYHSISNFPLEHPPLFFRIPTSYSHIHIPWPSRTFSSSSYKLKGGRFKSDHKKGQKKAREKEHREKGEGRKGRGGRGRGGRGMRRGEEGAVR